MKSAQTRHSIAPSLSLLLSFSLSIGLWGCSTPTSVSNSQQPSLDGETSSPVETIDQTSPMLTPELSPVLSLAQDLPLTASLDVNGHIIYLEVAETPRQQAIGLMYRTSLGDNRGMLFPFNPPRPVSFWMRNVEIDLDMVFLKDGQVIAIEAQVPPCRTDICEHYGPTDALVDHVIELRGGRASELGIAVGDTLILRDISDQ